MAHIATWAFWVQGYTAEMAARFIGFKDLWIGIWGFPKIRGSPFGVPINKDYFILGSILGSPYFGKLPFRV